MNALNVVRSGFSNFNTNLKDPKQLEEAIKSDIKWRHLKMVSQSLKKPLVNYYRKIKKR